MIELPLYARIPRCAIEAVNPLPRDIRCTRCPLSESAVSPCLPVDGEPGGLLIVGKAPGSDEDRAGKVFIGSSSKRARSDLAKVWAGPIQYTNAIACKMQNDGKVTTRQVSACRPYLAKIIKDSQPQRIIAFGAEAAVALFDRAVPPMGVRNGYCWIHKGPLVNEDTPVFFVMHPASIRGNRFIRKWFLQDIEAACRRVPPKPPLDGIAYIIETEGDAKQAYAEMCSASAISTDIESYGEVFEPEYEIICASVAAERATSAFVWDRKALSDLSIRQWYINILTNENVPKVLQNGKSDYVGLASAWNVRIANFAFDTRIGRRLIDPDARATLKLLAELSGMGGYKQEFEDLLPGAIKLISKAWENIQSNQRSLWVSEEQKRLEYAARRVAAGSSAKKFAFAFVDEEKLAVYNAKDSIATARAGILIKKRLAKIPPLLNTWENLMRDANLALAQMEIWGIPVDKRKMTSLSRYLKQKIDKITEDFVAYEFDPASPDQVADLLYKKLKLPCSKWTEKGAPSTDKEALQTLVGQHPIITSLLEHRRLEKLRGTYADGLFPLIRSDGRVHGTFWPDGARSGRLSMSDPNMLNQPRRGGGEALMVKDCFAPQDPNYRFLELDLSQIELRVAASEANDPVMKAIYSAGRDFHTETAKLIAKEVWNINPEDVTDEHRDPAKTANFLTIYGGGAGRLAAALNCEIRQAQRIIDAIYRQFKLYAAWSRNQVAFAERNGYVWVNWLGQPARYRLLTPIGNIDRDDPAVSTARNGASNSPVQGRAAYFVLASLKRVMDLLLSGKYRAKLILSVYDSLIFEVHKDDVAEVARRSRDIMIDWDNGGVPLVADAKIGPSWGKLEKYEI